jgi:hypothetical protein
MIKKGRLGPAWTPEETAVVDAYAARVVAGEFTVACLPMLELRPKLPIRKDSAIKSRVYDAVRVLRNRESYLLSER